RNARKTISASVSEREQQQERDQQREDAERFGHGETENQVAELALGCGRIAHRGGKIVAEDDAHAGARATHANAGNTSANVFRGNRIHESNSFSRFGVTGRSVARMDSVVDVDDGKDGKDVACRNATRISSADSAITIP